MFLVHTGFESHGGAPEG